ncbi:MAG: DNA repair protein RecN [Lachnospiraceae bacterium]|nr:DNA repair protein RecN [Lachnospiraceae bacterium]
MLESIHVENFALIDELTLEPGTGFNVFTGETGAGKSIIIDAVTAALGSNVSKDVIRKGSDHAAVELVFSGLPEGLREKLEEYDIQSDSDCLLISRNIRQGRSVSRINGEAVSLKMLTDITSSLIDIHGQHEHQSLLKKDRQLEMLDRFAREELGDLPEKLSGCYRKYTDCRRKLDAMDMDPEKRSREADLLRYEINEIEAAELQDGEDITLEERFRMLEHGERIRFLMEQASSLLSGDGGASDMTGRALSAVSDAQDYDEALKEIRDALMDADDILSGIRRDVTAYLDDMENDPAALKEAEERLDVINRLKSKYGRTIEDIKAYCSERRSELERLDSWEEELLRLKTMEKEALKEYESLADTVSGIRREKAKELEKLMTEAMKDLNFLTARFSIELEKTEPAAKGRDSVSFLISVNPGEDLKPLSKVASGGELSRIMLALRSVLASGDEVGTLIFDEIDTGISGRTAQKVAEKLFAIGSVNQVVCITHLPQIAAMADEQFRIEKHQEGERTVTTVERLSREGQVEELARMSGGARITDAVMKNAGEMKELADELKQKIRN